MKRFLPIFFPFALLLVLPVGAQKPTATVATTSTTAATASPTSATAVARQLLVVSGSGELGAQVAQQSIAGFKQMVPQVPPEFWQEFAKEINSKELIDMLVPVYEKHFTVAEMNALIKFYESDIGKALVKKQPMIALDSQKIGMKWGQELGEKIVERLKNKGHL